MSTRPSELTHIGPYRISEQLGEGGMGVVYLASAPDGTQVAVKTLRPWLVAGDGRRRFEREVATLRRVRGPRVAEVLDADIAADPPFMVTRFVPGTPLTTLVDERGPLRGEELMALARGLLEALSSVHQVGVVHRDVKPANVLLSSEGPVLIDFGIAHAADQTRLTATGFISGTPGYLAPETVIGHAPTPATDVHGWAATIVFAATGRPPYGYGPDIAVFERIRRGEHDLTGVDPGIGAVLGAALRVDPAARPDVTQALQALARPDDAETLAMPPVAGPAAPGEAPTIAAPAVPPSLMVSPQQARRAPTPPQPTPPQPVPQPAPPTTRMPQRATPPPPPPSPPALNWHYPLILGLGALLLLLVLSWAPYAGGAILLALLLLGRVSWRARRRLFDRRRARGRQPRDGLVAALPAPLDLVAAVLPTAGLAVVALIGALATGGLLGLVSGLDQRIPYLGAAAVAMVLAWWGPGAARPRHGITAIVAPLEDAPRAAWVVIGVLLVAVCAAVLTWESYGTVWWPADGVPEIGVPFGGP